MYSIKKMFWPMASQNHYKCFAKLLQLLCKTIVCRHGYLSYFFNFLIVGSYNFNHICQKSFISILLWSKYISLKILPCFIYTPPNYLSILFLQFSYSRVIQLWSHFSVFFYLNSLLKILLSTFISLLVFDFLIVGSYNFDHIFQNAFGQHLEKIHLCICQVL